MSESRERVETAVGTGYAVEQELGGGGMSRVFVAEEKALGRRVVIKVLSPELTATVSTDRFRREIQLAARLQHPHIVPLFAAGAGSDGLLFYTMPYIEGESLRARIARTGELPIPDAVGILRDIVDAIGYAHGRGVVHRDLKPENVLLSEGHAVVTDFGVAKALSDAVVADTLTSAGLALGTPAYMAPEQAAGDPTTDSRADLYAIGVIAYELLAGQAPFAGRSAQQIMAAHATATPEPLERRRASVPPALAQLVMRLLEKRPADRPQQAADVLRELNTVLTPQGGTVRFAPEGRPRVSRRALAIGGIVVAAAAVMAVMLRPHTAPPTDRNVVAIAPFRVAGADASLGYLREGMVDLLASVLTGEGTARAADPRSVMSAWRQAAGSDNADPSQDVALRVAERLGAGQLLLGSVVGNASQLALSATVIAVPGGNPIAQAKVEGHPDSLAKLVDRLAAQLIARQAGAADRVSALANVSIPALRAFLVGQSAYRHGRYAEAVQSFEQALVPDSTFAPAALALSVAANWAGGDEQIYRGGRLAWASRDLLSPRDRAYLELFWGPRFPDLARPQELVTAGERAIEVAPDNPEVWYEYGDALYHLGPAIGVEDAHDRARLAFQRAIELDSSFVAPRQHLIDVAANLGDTVLVRRLGAGYVAGDSGAGTAGYTRWRVVQALGDSVTARSIRARFENMDANSLHRILGFVQLDGMETGDVELVAHAIAARPSTSGARRTDLLTLYELALNRGRPAEARALLQRLRAVERRPGEAAANTLFAAIYWDGDTTGTAAAARELELIANTPGTPSDTGARFGLPQLCMLAQWRAARGDTQGTAAAIARLRNAHVPRDDLELSTRVRACLILTEALAALGDRSPDAASRIARLDSLMRVSPVLGHEGSSGAWVEGNLILARWYEAHGQFREAATAAGRRVYLWNVGTTALAPLLRQEARASARAGDRERALRAYRHYLALRSNPEPSMRPEVDQMRAEFQRLAREENGRR